MDTFHFIFQRTAMGVCFQFANLADKPAGRNRHSRSNIPFHCPTFFLALVTSAFYPPSFP